MAYRKLKIDPEEVKELARIGCKKVEVARMLGCSVDTIDRKFAEFFELGDVQGKVQLRRRQHQRAVEDGSDNMLIFLGKNRLGQEESEQPGVSREQLDQILTAIDKVKGGDAGGDRTGPDEGV